MASPSGYDDNYVVETPRGDCQLGVGLDKTRGNIDCFLVQLQYATSFLPSYQTTEISRIDHNPHNKSGHDLYAEGLHVDVVTPSGSDLKVWPSHSPLPQGGAIIRSCVEYYCSNIDYFVQVYEGKTAPNNPPPWP